MAGLSVRAETWKKRFSKTQAVFLDVLVTKRKFWAHFSNPTLKVGLEKWAQIFDVISQNGFKPAFLWRTQKRKNNIYKMKLFSSPNWPTKWWFQSFPCFIHRCSCMENSEITISLANLGCRKVLFLCLNMWPFNQTGNSSVNYKGDIREVTKILMNSECFAWNSILDPI